MIEDLKLYHRNYNKKYRATHPEFKKKSAVYHKRWQQAHPQNVREHNLKSHHGITLEFYEKLLAKQKGVCAICKRPPKKGGRSLAVDHSHTSGKIRGILCNRCNLYLGWIKDDPKTIKCMLKYLCGRQRKSRDHKSSHLERGSLSPPR